MYSYDSSPLLSSTMTLSYSSSHFFYSNWRSRRVPLQLRRSVRRKPVGSPALWVVQCHCYCSQCLLLWCNLGRNSCCFYFFTDTGSFYPWLDLLCTNEPTNSFLKIGFHQKCDLRHPELMESAKRGKLKTTSWFDKKFTWTTLWFDKKFTWITWRWNFNCNRGSAAVLSRQSSSRL